MSWQGVIGHDAVVERFRRGLRADRLGGSYLFVGPAGIGKRTLAHRLAQALLCEGGSPNELEACGHCSACRQVLADTHPDLITISKPPDKNFIPVELFIGDREHRMREGLCHDISLKPFRGGRKIAIIDDADDLNQEGANCLLKTLEEPPRHSLLILIGTSEHRQLPTVRSRCQIVRFRPLSRDMVAQLLRDQDPETSALADTAAAMAEGSLQRAVELTQQEVIDFRQQFFDRLRVEGWDARELVSLVTEFVDRAGKDAPPRRARVRQTAQMACDFYRQLLKTVCGTAGTPDPMLQNAVQFAAKSQADEERILACLDRCLDVFQHVDANANQSTMIECWLDDLAQILRGGPIVTVGAGR